MGEPTVTLQVLRRAIASELQMPFAKRFRTSLTVDASSTVSKILDASLTQEDSFWANQWFYHITSQTARLITEFQADDDSLWLEQPLASVTAGDAYEIHSTWNALEIHDAINRVIRAIGRAYPDAVEDETLVLKEDVLSYTISGLTKTPWHVTGVALERCDNVVRGTVDSATASSLTDAGVDFSDCNSNYRVSIYYGTGAGQLRTVSSGTALGVLNVSVNWTVNPDTTSKYAVWNPSVDNRPWLQVMSIDFSSPEFPDTLRFLANYSNFYGMRIRLSYDSVPGELSAETDTTTVNKEYIIAAACSLLHGQVLSDTRFDRELHYGEYVRFNEKADAILSRIQPHSSATPIWQGSAESELSSLNPLGWVR